MHLPLILLLSAALLLPACHDEEPALAVGVNPVIAEPFAEGFLWGTATAGFQVDMGCPTTPCLDTASDWYQWVTTQSVIDDGFALGHPLQDGPGHWELFAEDFDLAANELHNNGYRMSIEWSRIFPQSTIGVEGHNNLKAIADADSIAHYHAVFDALIERGITPMVTLIHYSMPLWIHNGAACYETFNRDGNVEACPAKGWLEGATLVTEMTKYAGFVAGEFGSKVDLWATHNEPYAVILAGYSLPTPAQRTNPPGIAELSFEFAAPVIRTMIVSHARMYDAVQAADTGDADGDGAAAVVGIVMNLAQPLPKDPDNPLDLEAVDNFNYLYNWLFLDAASSGNWDEDLDGTPDEVRSDLKDRLDFVGINYYSSVNLLGQENPVADFVPVLTFLPDTFLFFDFKPQGLYHVTKSAWERYKLPIYITENGSPFSGEVTGADSLVPHLAWLRLAAAEGADLRGYFYWSLMDNYEWNHGYDLEFGLYRYDPVSKARTPRGIVPVYGEIAAGNRLTHELLNTYGNDALPATP